MQGENMNTITRNAGYLLEASGEVGLQVDTEKTKYMFVSRHQNVIQDKNSLIANKSFESVGSSNVLEQQQTKITLTKKLRAD